MSDSKLVYSTDPKLNQKCPRCKELVPSCSCPKEPLSKGKNYVVTLRIEKSGRGGKTVTVIDGLPKIEFQLKELTTRLKKKCGSGGTYLMDGKEGVIEIQGDKRELIRAFFTAEGIKAKG